MFNIGINWIVLQTKHLCLLWKFQFIVECRKAKEELSERGSEWVEEIDQWNDAANQ